MGHRIRPVDVREGVRGGVPVRGVMESAVEAYPHGRSWVDVIEVVVAVVALFDEFGACSFVLHLAAALLFEVNAV